MKFFEKNKKIVIPIAVILVVAATSIGILTSQAYSDKIAKNVIVSGINIGGMNKEAAIKELERQDKFKNITLTFQDGKWVIPQSEIDLKINFEKTVDNAFAYNKGNGYFTNIGRTLKADLGNKSEIALSMTYDKNSLEKKLQSIKEELDTPIRNATLNFINDKVEVVKDKPGKDMNVEASLNKIEDNLEKNDFDTELVVKLSKAAFTAKDLEGIDSLLGEYSTTFGGMASRDYNIKKSVVDSSGVLLKPGEEYSFNGITGEKTLSNGYKNAPVIESGKLVLGTGGGVCQTSSTIFNAALLSGMEITSRRNHTIPSDYVDLGRDATVVDGEHGQDFRFKNPFKHSVYVKNYYAGNQIGSQIYGSKEDKQNIKIATEMLGSFGGGNKTVNDPTLPVGKKVVEKYARPGYNVATYRIYKDENGNILKTEKVATSTYPAQTGIVRVGAAAIAPKGANSAKNSLGLNGQKPVSQQTGSGNYGTVRHTNKTAGKIR